jgi:hypothetical protein
MTMEFKWNLKEERSKELEVEDVEGRFRYY